MDNIRIGKITSSGFVDIAKDGRKAGEVSASFGTYLKRKKQERKLTRSMSKEDNGKACKWGSLVESYLMQKKGDFVGLNYTLTPQSTLAHPKYADVWVGSRDGLNNDTNAVIDIKCPYTLESFCDFADCETIQDVIENHKDGEKYYWQLVSNACIHGTNKAELIIFCPNLQMLNEIMVFAGTGENEGNSEYYFIAMGKYEDFPYIPNESSYFTKYTFAFDIPDEDFQKAENRVKLAIPILEK